MPNSLSELHTLHAWEDNQITERCTQGEYAGKILQFKLVDKDGAINLSNCLVQYAVTRPDKTEDLLNCTVDNGVVKCNLTYSVTSVVGLVRGEVRVIGSNDSGIIKFYGVNLRVYKGVSDEAAEQSDEFTALIAALQKVVSITPDPDSENTYVVRLDDSIVQNGLNPVASGVIYDYLVDKQIENDKRFELQSTVGFNENGIPVFTSNNTSFSAGACSVGSIKTLFIASNVTTISSGAFNTTANQNITTVYIDNKQTDITIQSGAFPSGATIYYKGQFNALGFVIAALKNLSTSKLDDANNSVKTNHITDGNVTEDKLSSEVQAKINKNTGVYTYTISASNWNNKAQILNLSSVYTVTSKTKVDIEADDTALNQLSIGDCEGIYVENNNGTLTVKAITNSPTENITVQLVVYEVETLS